MLFQTGGDINQIHQKKVDRMFQWGLTVQPYIIGVSNTLENVDNFYVMVDQARYRFHSPLKALDTCFKIFFTLSANYPLECQQVWMFLQYACIGWRRIVM